MKKIFFLALLLLCPVLAQAQGFDFIGKVPCTDVVEGYRCHTPSGFLGLGKSNPTGTIYTSKETCQTACEKAENGGTCNPYITGGVCSIDSLMSTASLVIQWITGISGAIALVMFVIGGIYFLTSGGNQSRIQKGKDILTATVIALFFILGSWILVNFIVSTLACDPDKDPNCQLDLRLQTDCEDKTDGDSCGQTNTGICYQGACIDKCQYRNISDPPQFDGYTWSCKPLDVCNGGAGTSCENLAPFCAPGLCPGSTYCCYNPLEEFSSFPTPTP